MSIDLSTLHRPGDTPSVKHSVIGSYAASEYAPEVWREVV